MVNFADVSSPQPGVVTSMPPAVRPRAEQPSGCRFEPLDRPHVRRDQPRRGAGSGFSAMPTAVSYQSQCRRRRENLVKYQTSGAGARVIGADPILTSLDKVDGHAVACAPWRLGVSANGRVCASLRSATTLSNRRRGQLSGRSCSTQPRLTPLRLPQSTFATAVALITNAVKSLASTRR